MRRKDHMDPVRSFNESLRAIFDIFAELPSTRFKAAVSIRVLREKLLKGISAQPTYSIVVLGPYILSSSKDIESGDAGRILQMDHAPHIIALGKVHDFDIGDAARCIAFMKDAYQDAPPPKRVAIIGHCRTMLSSYARHLIQRTEERKS